MTEPRTVTRIRKSPAAKEGDIATLLWYVDQMQDKLKRYENLSLTTEQAMEVAGPATTQIGGKDLWELGATDLRRLANAFLEAAMRARQA